MDSPIEESGYICQILRNDANATFISRKFSYQLGGESSSNCNGNTVQCSDSVNYPLVNLNSQFDSIGGLRVLNYDQFTPVYQTSPNIQSASVQHPTTSIYALNASGSNSPSLLPSPGYPNDGIETFAHSSPNNGEARETYLREPDPLPPFDGGATGSFANTESNVTQNFIWDGLPTPEHMKVEPGLANSGFDLDSSSQSHASHQSINLNLGRPILLNEEAMYYVEPQEAGYRIPVTQYETFNSHYAEMITQENQFTSTLQEGSLNLLCETPSPTTNPIEMLNSNCSMPSTSSMAQSTEGASASRRRVVPRKEDLKACFMNKGPMPKEPIHKRNPPIKKNNKAAKPDERKKLKNPICARCDTKFESINEMRTHQADKTNKCAWIKKDSLKDSSKEFNTGKKPWICNYSNCKFASKNLFVMKDHNDEHIKKGESLSGAKFKENKSGKRERVRHPEEEIKCLLCNYKCTFETTFSKHIDKHLNGEEIVNEFNCFYCTTDYPDLRKTRDCEKRHIDNNGSYRCKYCDNFSTKQRKKMIQHFRIHYGDKCHVCYLCDTGFNRKDNLDTHLKGHIDSYLKGHPDAHLKAHIDAYMKGHPDANLEIHLNELKEKNYICMYSPPILLQSNRYLEMCLKAEKIVGITSKHGTSTETSIIVNDLDLIKCLFKEAGMNDEEILQHDPHLLMPREEHQPLPHFNNFYPNHNS